MIPDIYGVTHLTPDLSAGIAVTSPFGLPVKYNSAWVGRYDVIQAEALTADINPNLAYKINDKLSVAGGLSAQYLTFELSTAINQSFIRAHRTRSRGSRATIGRWAIISACCGSRCRIRGSASPIARRSTINCRATSIFSM